MSYWPYKTSIKSKLISEAAIQLGKADQMFQKL